MKDSTRSIVIGYDDSIIKYAKMCGKNPLIRAVIDLKYFLKAGVYLDRVEKLNDGLKLTINDKELVVTEETLTKANGDVLSVESLKPYLNPWISFYNILNNDIKECEVTSTYQRSTKMRGIHIVGKGNVYNIIYEISYTKHKLIRATLLIREGKDIVYKLSKTINSKMYTDIKGLLTIPDQVNSLDRIGILFNNQPDELIVIDPLMMVYYRTVMLGQYSPIVNGVLKPKHDNDFKYDVGLWPHFERLFG